jgi:hypothetical protein
MRLVVNRSQLSKYKNGKPFQLSKDQVQERFTGGALFEIDVPDSLERSINKAKRSVKGVRLVHHGGSIGSAFRSIGNSIKSTANKAVSSVSRSANKTGDAIESSANQTGRVLKAGLETTGEVIVDSAKKLNRMALKADLGGYVEKVKDVVPQSVLTTILTTALVAGATATGQPQLIAMAPALANSATSAFYAVDFGESLKGQGDDALRAAALSGAKSGLQSGAKYASDYNKQQATQGGSLNPFLIDDNRKAPGLIPRGRPRKTSGGSFRPVGSRYDGDGFKPSGSGFKPSGSGVPRTKMVRGSPEALEWARKMQEARARKRG